MNPLILSLICLVIVGITANLIKLIKESKILLQLSILPCVYLVIYGCYLIFGPIDLYKDGTENFFNQNPNKELPIVFVLLKFYQYILSLKLDLTSLKSLRSVWRFLNHGTDFKQHSKISRFSL